MARAYREQRNFMQVLETLQRAAQIVEQIKDKSRLAEIYAGIGTIYRYLNQSSEAIAYIIEP